MDSQPIKMYRTLLFAPGSRPELLSKAQLGDADSMIFDLEDSVPLNAKDEARKNIADAQTAPCNAYNLVELPA